MTRGTYHQERGLLSGPRVHERPDHTVSVRREVLLPATAAEVFDFCLSVEGYSSIMPYRVDMIGYSAEQVEEGMSIAFTVWFRNVLPVRWVAYLEEVYRPRRFVDLQTRGMFRYFRHTHSCEPHDAGTRYTDHVEFATRLGRWVDNAVMKGEIERLFAHRQQRMAELLGD